MTLLEVLIVVVILALAYGMLARGLLAYSESGQQRLAVATWKELDGLARQMAVAKNRSVRLELAPNGMTVHCRMISTDELVATRSLATPLTLRNSGDMKVLDMIQIDGRGSCVDYVVESAQGSTHGVWKVLGLTGQWIEVEAGGAGGDGNEGGIRDR